MRKFLWLATHGRLRRPNARLVVCLVVAGAMLSVAAHLVHGFQCRRNASDLLQRAEAGELKQSVGHLSRYLSLVPEDTDGMAKFALALDELASTDRERMRAFLAMEKVLREAPARQDVRRRLARLGMEWMEGWRIADAADHLEILLKSSPDDAELHQWLGQCLERQGKHDDAAKEFRAAITHAPEQIENYVRLSRLLRDRLEEPDEADAVIDQMVASNEDSPNAYLARSLYRSGQKTEAATDRDKITADVNSALELAQTDADVLLVAAQLAEAKGELGEALGHARVGLEHHSQDVRMYRTCARLELRRGSSELAIGYLRQGLAEFPDDIELRWVLADVLIEQGELAAARAEIEQLRKPKVPPAVVDYFDARIAMGEGRWAEAAEQLERARTLLVRSSEMTKRVDFLLGECYRGLNDTERQLIAYRRAVRADPLWTSARLRLASTLLAAGRAEEALGEYRLALRMPAAQAFGWPEVARSLIVVNLRRTTGQKDWREVDQALAEGARANPDSVVVPLLRAEALWAQGQFEPAEEQVRAALAMRPDDSGLQQFVANFSLRTGRFDEAAQLLRKMIDPQASAPAATVTWARRTLAALQGASGNYQEFCEALELLEPTGDDQVVADDDQRIRAVLLARRNSRSLQREAIAILEQLTERDPPMPADQFLIAQLYEANGDWPNAHIRLLSLLESVGDAPHYVAYFARALLRHSQVEEAQRWIEKFEQVQPDVFETLELRSRALVAQGEHEETVRMLKAYAENENIDGPERLQRVGLVAALLDELGQLAAAEEMYREYVSNRPGATLVLVEYLGRQGRRQEALELCKRAWQSCPPDAVAAATVSLLRAGGASAEQFISAGSRIEEAIEKNAGATSLLLCLADLRDLESRFDEAESLYRRVIERDEDDVMALNNLAWLLALTPGKAAEALPLINRALDIAGPEPELLDTRAIVHLAMGEIDRAIADLQEVIGETPTASKYFHLAAAYLKANNRDAAAAAFQRARVSGLDLDVLHPLERPTYELLLASF